MSEQLLKMIVSETDFCVKAPSIDDLFTVSFLKIEFIFVVNILKNRVFVFFSC